MSRSSLMVVALLAVGPVVDPGASQALSGDPARGDVSRSLPMLYVIPARGGVPGGGWAEIAVSRYSLYSSPAPSGEASEEETVLTTRLGIGFSLTERLSLWAEPEVRRLRWRLGSGQDLSATDLADLWVGARLSPPINENLIRLGMAGMVLLPTGREDVDGRAGDFSTGGTDYAVVGLCDLDLSRYFGADRCILYVNCGYRWHRNETDGSHVWPDVSPAVPPGQGAGFNDVLLLRLGWSYRAHSLGLEAEIRGDRFVNASDQIGWLENPISAAAAVRKWFRGRLWVRLGGEVALSSGGPEVAGLPDPKTAYPDWVIFASAGTAIRFSGK